VTVPTAPEFRIASRRGLTVSIIDQKHHACGGERGFLGRPIGPESETPDGRGRFRRFEGGSIYATAETGVHEVHGSIYAKWAEMGWETSVLGYPIADEGPTPDGRGRISRFQGGSIVWTPATGPVVHTGPEAVGGCSISGRVYGPAARLKDAFSLSLYGPGDRSLLQETTRFDASGRYRFAGLPVGQYWITLTAHAQVHVEPFPHEKEIFCTGGLVSDVDFQLR
jgi:uncharacterized protein with LGFP repeats